MGSLFAALLATKVAFANDAHLVAALEVSRRFAENTPWRIVAHGILAGFFIGTLVWMLPSARGSEFWVIVFITYFIGVGEFAHIIAGSTEVFLLMLAGEIRPLATITAFIIPAMIGNIIGGTFLFSLIAYAQVRQEMPKRDTD